MLTQKMNAVICNLRWTCCNVFVLITLYLPNVIDSLCLCICFCYTLRFKTLAQNKWNLIISVNMCMSNLCYLCDLLVNIANLFFLLSYPTNHKLLKLYMYIFYRFIVEFCHVEIHTVYNTSKLIKHHMNCFYLQE